MGTWRRNGSATWFLFTSVDLNSLFSARSKLEIYHYKFRERSDRDLNSILCVIYGDKWSHCIFCCGFLFYFDLYVGLNIIWCHVRVCVCSLFYVHQMLWLCKCCECFWLFSSVSWVYHWAVLVPWEVKLKLLLKPVQCKKKKVVCSLCFCIIIVEHCSTCFRFR